VTYNSFAAVDISAAEISTAAKLLLASQSSAICCKMRYHHFAVFNVSLRR